MKDTAAGEGRKDLRQRGFRGRKRRWVRMLGWPLFILFDLLVILGLVLFLTGHLMTGRDIVLPQWVADEAGAVLSRGLGGGRVEIGAVTLRIEETALPRLFLDDLQVLTPAGAILAAVPNLEVSIDKRALWRGKVQPRSLRVDGATIRTRRGADGSFDLGFGDNKAPAAFGSLEEAIVATREVFDLPSLAPVERIEVQGLEVLHADERVGRSWQVSGGTMLLTHAAADGVSLSVSMDLPDEEGADGPPASVALRLSIGVSGAEAEASALVQNVRAEDIAAQSPALSWLQPLKARVSGAMIVGMTPQGDMGPLNGTLEIGAGVFQPETAARPIRFERVRTYFGYRPDLARISFEEITVEGPDGTISALGHAYLEGLETGWPTALIGQLHIEDLWLAPPGFLAQPVRFVGGAIDAKITLAPFAARIGQMVLTLEVADGPDPQLSARGRVLADDDGWHVALDTGIDRIDMAPLLALWPLELLPGTRQWMQNHLLEGEVFGLTAALRRNQGQRPDVAMSFQFHNSVLQPIRTMPPFTGADGYAAIGRDRFSVTVDRASITPPRGGVIDVAGSTFHVADMRQNPSRAEISLRATSSVTAALSLLDQPPFGFLKRAGQPVDLADGQARLEGWITFPIKPRLTAADVAYDVAGTAVDVRSEQAVPERLLKAEELAFRATPEAVRISGAARLDGIPLDGRFTLPFGEEAAPPTVAGRIALGEEFVRTFGIGLPEGMVTGSGSGDFTLTLPPGAAPRFTMASALAGIGLAIDQVGWRKPAGQSGRLEVTGRLGARPVVDRLTLDAAGLTAVGAITLADDGGLGQALFSRVSIGNWIDAPITLTGQGESQDPAIALRGGRLDLRGLETGGSANGGTGAPISAALDRLVISEGIALTDFRGAFTQQGAMAGRFEGAVNGRARVRGTLSPGRNGGSAVTVRSDNAGAVFKAAGIFGQGDGGTLSVVLQPRREAGEYDGTLKVEDVRVRDSSGLTALFNAISVVGLLDELSGSGLLFSDVEAEFRLTPAFVHVKRSSGVGPSLGISMEGVYDMLNDRLDMQGVFSPLYMVNSIGRIFTRKGEGLVGFTYQMTGSSGNPRVTVNPLSALTPGMFREIFRAQPPRPGSGGG